MMDVTRFLGLSVDEKSDVGSPTVFSQRKSSSAEVKMGHPRNYRELDTERKKLKRELDKLNKAHTKTTKTLDNFLTNMEMRKN